MQPKVWSLWAALHGAHAAQVADIVQQALASPVADLQRNSATPIWQEIALELKEFVETQRQRWQANLTSQSSGSAAASKELLKIQRRSEQANRGRRSNGSAPNNLTSKARQTIQRHALIRREWLDPFLRSNTTEVIQIANTSTLDRRKQPNHSNLARGPQEVFVELERQLRNQTLKLVASRNYSLEEPVVVTALDGAYLHFLPKWASRLAKLGCKQQIIWALDVAVKKLAVEHALPSLYWEQHSLLEGGPMRFLPPMVTLVKFLVPALLLEAGFDTVVFSELDVYWFSNPIPYLVASQTAAPVSLLASEGKPANTANIGFMVFRGKHIESVLKQYLLKWVAEEHQKNVRMMDQISFNQFIAGKDLLQFLNPALFALNVSTVSNSTAVLHLAHAWPSTKICWLQQLYENASFSPSNFSTSACREARHHSFPVTR